MDKFEEWFDSEYSNFGRKASTFYSADHDFYTSQFIDERYDAYQAGHQSRQAELDQANYLRFKYLHLCQVVVVVLVMY
ncbi:hypothetical protein ASC84_19115 [Acinetobacter sp. Root1280]|uniref:hypothetical protein n=1 Tax=Acinetobacter sp. Root1280 TaxID=1736444 RepID=UPI0006FF4ABB|nr:hypothetical protein [Acinetobacter sp. Root1280]KQX00139.1 hypothetical protein ASC84_19115 [Acinetobacter sp. Root1280]